LAQIGMIDRFGLNRMAAPAACGCRSRFLALVAAAKALQAERPRLSLRKISLRLAEQGITVPAPPSLGGGGKWKIPAQ